MDESDIWPRALPFRQTADVYLYQDATYEWYDVYAGAISLRTDKFGQYGIFGLLPER